MPTWEDELLRSTEAGLGAADEAGPDEVDSLNQSEEVRSLLAEFYKHELEPDWLCRRLESGTAVVIKESQLALVKSLGLGLRLTWFRTTKAAILQLERLKRNQRVNLLERQLNKIGELQRSYRETLEETLQEVTEQENRHREPTISQGRWIAIHGTLSVDTDLAERLAESQMEAERLYGDEFAMAVRQLILLVEQDEQ